MNRDSALACAAFVLVTAIAAGLLPDLRRPSIRGDGVGYYAPLASVVIDGDLELRNELEHLNPRYLQAAFMTPEGKLGDPFPIGPALLWAPAVFVARALPAIQFLDAPVLESTQTPHPGFAPRYARALAGTDFVLVLLGGSVLAATLAATCGWMRAAGACVAAVFGTPVAYYTLADPSYGHAASFAVVAVFVAAVWRDRAAVRTGAAPPGKSLPLELLGALFGIVTLVRSQDAALGVLLLPRLLEEWRGPRRAQLWRLAWPAVLAFLPQMLFWQRIYGKFLLVPPGPDIGPLWKPQVFHLLFSTWNGILPWSPVLLLGLLGWILVRDRPLRLALAVALLLALYSSAILLDWWGGNAFGPRRLTALAPLAAIGLAHALTGSRVRSWVLGLVLLLLCAFDLRLADYKVRHLLPGNPGNAADYVRHYAPGSKRTFPYGHLDYARLIAECFEAERMRGAQEARGREERAPETGRP